MKTTSKKIVFGVCSALIGIALLSCDSKEKEIIRNVSEDSLQNKQALANAITLPEEDTIDFAGYSVKPKSGDSLRDLFSKIRLNNYSLKMPDVAEIIDIRAFKKLSEISFALESGLSVNYIRCIGIAYGLDTSLKKVKLFYKPVLLKKISDPVLKLGAKYAPVVAQTYYEYSLSGDTFAQVASDAAMLAIKNYTSNITFKDPTETLGYRHYIENNDSTGDVRLVIYPFQELDSIITSHDASHIYFFNIGQTFKANNKTYLRHNILIGSNTVHVISEFEKYGFNKAYSKDKLKEPVFYAKYGNLSHLCPPSCTVAKFNLKPKDKKHK